MRAADVICWLALMSRALVASPVAPASELSKTPTDYKFEADEWRERAIAKLWQMRSSKEFYTKLVPFEDPANPNTVLLLKDEASSASMSLKHRFAWALFMWGLIQGYIKENTTVVEASSGNTAVSEAYWAKQIGVPFFAVIGTDTEPRKVNRILMYNGSYRFVEPGRRVEEAEKFVSEDPLNRFFMNQFKNADKAEEYFDSGHSHRFETVNVFHEILRQMNTSSRVRRMVKETHEPDYFVQAAGTGGTISSVGRYIRKYQKSTTVVLADTEFSTYYDWTVHGTFGRNDSSGKEVWRGPGISGIGFGPEGQLIQGETTSLLPAVVDMAVKLPDLASVAAMHLLRNFTGLDSGPSSGANFLALLHVLDDPKRIGTPDKPLVLSTLVCDTGSTYEESYMNWAWIAQNFSEDGGLPRFTCFYNILHEALYNRQGPIFKGLRSCIQAFPGSVNENED